MSDHGAVIASLIRHPQDLLGWRILCPHCGLALRVVRVMPAGGYWAVQLEDGEWARYWPHATDG
jgi:hypothetical protein